MANENDENIIVNAINNNNNVNSNNSNLTNQNSNNFSNNNNNHNSTDNEIAHLNGNFTLKSNSSVTYDENGLINSNEEIHLIQQKSKHIINQQQLHQQHLQQHPQHPQHPPPHHLIGNSSSTNSLSRINRTNSKSPNSYFNDLPERGASHNRIMNEDDEDDGLGPLPPKWEKAYTENGEVYFIDNNTGTSHWLDPRLSKFPKKSLEECMDDELPYGWEKIHDPQYGTYFIDHVNRRTQYENPVLQAKRRNEQIKDQNGPHSSMHHNHNHNHSQKSIFTRNPAELMGERITTTLLKSSRGLGFTIVGGDDNVDEFLQIKSIVPNGPAWLDGKLQMGDILVYVNDTCVLGFTHHEMVNVFQSILPGETVTLEVCRGYPLPFDPNDPNTEVVTTIAVDGINADPESKSRILMDLNMDGNYNFLDLSDGVNNNKIGNGPIMQKNPLSKIQSGSIRSDGSDTMSNEMNRIILDKPEILTISIVKGAMGFGFTIADSAHGQKVKKILDRNCCKNLMEGDVLLTINATGVRNMSHSEVVQVLKDCAKGQEAVLKIQRVPQYSTVNLAAKASNKLRKAAINGNGNLSKDPMMFRSKTPTADLYSTQPKEILPTRPKTPLVDTRERTKTPSNIELQTDDVDSPALNDKHEDLKGGQSDTKSNNSLHDQDSITNDIPSMDPFPKFMTHLTERLAHTTIHEHQNNIYHNPVSHGGFSSQSDLNNYDQPIQNEYYNYHQNGGYTVVNGNGGYSNMYSPPPVMPIMAPVPTYHQDTCYCYECQDYNRQHQEYMMQQQYYLPHHSQLKLKLLDRRKASGFTPLESVPFPSPSQQHQYWKYGHPSPGGQQELLQPIGEEEYSLSEVTLERQTLGFGFRIVGGTEEGSQVTVGHIVPGGSADKDPRIQTGDEILSIDGVNVVGGSHHRVVQLMGEAALRGQVTMILRRRSRQILRYPYDVIVSRNENEGFGFVIISSSNQYYGSTIGKLIAGSPADRCGEIKVGDRIIAVNRIDIIGMSHGDVVNLIKESGFHVRLTIGNPRDPHVINQHTQQQHQQQQMQQQQQQQQQLHLQQQHHQQQQQQQQQQHQQMMVANGSSGGSSSTTKNEQYFDRYPINGSQPQL